jgi:RNA polymerase sigma-70 factor (ECF subfamily)
MSQPPPDQPRGPRSDPGAWVDFHGDFLFRYAVVRIGDLTAAEDLVQETFLAALRSANAFAGGSAERTWLVGILKHKIVDYLRRRSREQPLGSDASSADDALFDARGRWQVPPQRWPTNPSQLLEQQEFWEAFRRCLEKLPPKLRTVFLLREMDELPTQQACECLNVTPGNISVLLYRARMGLRRCLETHWFHPRNGT